MHPHLGGSIVALVIGAGMLHALWNAIAKYVDDRLVAFALLGVVATVVGAAGLIVPGLPAGDAIVFAVVSAVLHALYNAALMQSYRLGAFNQTYPIARGTSPLVV